MQLGRRRRALVVKGLLVRATKRTKRVRQLRKAGAHTASLALIQVWFGGSQVLGFDPVFRHHRLVILACATGDWEGTPDLDTMQAALRGSLARLSLLKRPWCGATDAAATFVFTLLRLGWRRSLRGTSQDGTEIDFLAVAPKMVSFWMDQASLLWSDSFAHWHQSKGPFFCHQTTPRFWQAGRLVTLVSKRSKGLRLRNENDGSCQLCMDQAPCSTVAGNASFAGSSLGNGALRRAGWAAVAVDDASNLKSDILPWQSARDGEDCAAATGSCDRERRGTILQTLSKTRAEQSRFSRRQDSCCLFVLGQASGTLGGRGARFAQVQGWKDTRAAATITGMAPANETQAKAGEGDCCAGCRSPFRLVFTHFSLTFHARQSLRPSHFQRAQLAIGTSF